MSKQVDNRVVQMEFDNSNFEKNVQTSLGTLDRLKSALKLDGAASGLNEVSSAAKKFTLDGIGTAVETVSSKFTALGIIGVTALQNITNKAVDAGEKLVKSLTIEPISAGFKEYELKMGSIQTIMAGTGETLETVNKYLNELNLYSDKTIYSFSDMTSNIGKFTNAGVKLKDAVSAIQGVANVAAVSGANANEASRAMYNFSQALSAGAVKLIDWKSIENANMATVEFKQQLIDTAVAMGTLVKEGDKYKSTTTDAAGKVSDLFDATFNFNNALSAQWMTTDVLTQTLSNYSTDLSEMTDAEKKAWRTKLQTIGYTEEQIAGIEALSKKAFASATEIKTWTMLVDTLTESAGSGWATTWELVFGDFEKAKELWTKLNDVIGPVISDAADARNSVLEIWNGHGGRDAVLQGLLNLIDAAKAIVQPFKDAWDAIFPSSVVKKATSLIDICYEFQNLTQKLILNTDIDRYTRFDKSIQTYSNIVDTLKGVLAIFDIAKQAAVALLDAIKPVFSSIFGLGDGILDTTASMGRWLVALDESIKENDTFGNAINNVITFFKNFISVINTSVVPVFERVIDKVKEMVSNFNDLTGGVLEKVKTGFTNLVDSITGSASFDILSKAIDGLTVVLETLWNVVSKVGSAIGSVLRDIVASFTSGGQESTDLLNAGVFGGIIALLISLKDKFKGLSSIGDIAGSITGVLDSVKDTLTAFQEQIKAKQLLEIGIAIGILTASLAVLASIDAVALASAIGALAAVMELMKSFSTYTGTASTGMGNAITNFIDSKSTKTTATAMIEMAAAILILSVALKNLASVPFGGIIKGTVAIAALMAAMALFEVYTSGDKAVKGASSFILMATAVLILSSALKSLAELKWEELAKGIAGVAALMATLAGFSKLAGGSKNMVSIGVGMIALAAAMKILVSVVEDLGNMSLATLGTGILAMAVALGVLAAALNFMPATTPLIGVGLLAVAAALLILSQAVETFGNMKLEEIGKALLALFGTLTILTAAMIAMQAGIVGAAALVVVAAALALLVPPLILLGNMDMASIGKAMLTLAGGLTILVVAGAAATVVAPGLLVLSVAMVALGVAVMGIGTGLILAGAGLTAMAVGLSTLASLGSVAAVVVVNALTMIANAILMFLPNLAVSLAQSFVSFVQTIASLATILMPAITTILDTVLQAIIDVVPKICETVMTIITSVLSTIAEHSEEIITSIMDIIIGLINGLTEKVPEFIQAAEDLVLALIEGIENMTLDLVDAGFQLIVDLLNGLADSIRENTPLVIEATDNLMSAILEAIFLWFGSVFEKGAELVGKVIEGITSKFEEVKQAARDLISGFIDGILEGIEKVKEAAKKVANKVVETVKDVFDENSPSKVFYGIGEFVDEGLALGIKSGINGVVNASEKMASTAIDTMSNAISSIRDAVDDNFDDEIVIRPVLDLSNITDGARSISSMFENGRISAYGDDSTSASGASYNFVQNNYSPKALSRIDIYRQTKNQFSMMKGVTA